MAVNVTPHLNFRGDARAALEFYQSVFGGDLMIMSYQDMGNVQDPSEANQVVWGQVAAESGFRVMAYDVPSSRPWSPGEDPFFVSLRGEATEEITAYWEKLSDGATVMRRGGGGPGGAYAGPRAPLLICREPPSVSRSFTMHNCTSMWHWRIPLRAMYVGPAR